MFFSVLEGGETIDLLVTPPYDGADRHMGFHSSRGNEMHPQVEIGVTGEKLNGVAVRGLDFRVRRIDGVRFDEHDACLLGEIHDVSNVVGRGIGWKVQDVIESVDVGELNQLVMTGIGYGLTPSLIIHSVHETHVMTFVLFSSMVGPFYMMNMEITSSARSLSVGKVGWCMSTSTWQVSMFTMVPHGSETVFGTWVDHGLFFCTKIGPNTKVLSEGCLVIDHAFQSQCTYFVYETVQGRQIAAR